MIKIIEHGNVCRCTDCSCLFSFEKEDIKSKNYISSVRSDIYTYVKCPDCGAEIIVVREG